LINTKHRIDTPEIMDDFTLKGEVLQDALDKISNINQLLGGNKLTLQGVKDLLHDTDPSNEITIVDLGCGNGDMLRMLADYSKKNNLSFKLIGIDANRFTINYAQELSVRYSNISYHCEDIFGKAISELKYDIALLTLTLHHFKNDQIANILDTCHKNAKIGIVINDLHRSGIAYRLFQGLCFILRLNPISKHDGLASILRGFKKEELIPFSEKLNCKNYKIRWKWAFRYQWIISKV
jgi:2-polyprenyl-3-methyl-5-hydroxy-6-metoxy-1,4-benzoquinol methylase